MIEDLEELQFSFEIKPSRLDPSSAAQDMTNILLYGHCTPHDWAHLWLRRKVAPGEKPRPWTCVYCGVSRQEEGE